MALNLCIVCLLMFQSYVVAEENLNTGSAVNGQILFVVGIILTSVFAAVSLVSLSYCILKLCKRKMSEPQYYVDDVPIVKDGNEYLSGNNDIPSQIPHITQIQPILSVPQIVSSIKQSLEDLHHSLKPFRWSNAQHESNQQSPVKEKMDSPI